MSSNHLIEKDLKTKVKEELGYDSDLLYNDEDEERLNKMPEIAREAEFEERRTKRE